MTVKSENSSVREYETDFYLKLYERSGVPKRFWFKWFWNYICKTKLQGERIKTLKECLKTPKPIIMLGRIRTGKSHLACSFLKNRLIAGNQGHYYTLSNLFREYRSSMQNGGESRFFNYLTMLDCLVIDEFGIRSDSDAENRFLQELIDARYSNIKCTIFIANLEQQEFRGIVGERIVKRLKEQNAVEMIFTEEIYQAKDDVELLPFIQIKQKINELDRDFYEGKKLREQCLIELRQWCDKHNLTEYLEGLCQDSYIKSWVEDRKNHIDEIPF